MLSRGWTWPSQCHPLWNAGSFTSTSPLCLNRCDDYAERKFVVWYKCMYTVYTRRKRSEIWVLAVMNMECGLVDRFWHFGWIHCQDIRIELLSGTHWLRQNRPPVLSVTFVPCDSLKADSHTACRAHAVPLPCPAAKGLECVFPNWFTQSSRVWFTLAMPCPCHALTVPFFSRPRHSTAVERRPVGYRPAFGYFRLPCGVPRRLLSAAYQSSLRSIPTTVKSGSSTLQKRRSVKLMD